MAVRAQPRRRKESAKEEPIFLRKTYDMICAMPRDIGGWSENGDTFVIRDPEAFAQRLIPKFFKQGSKFSSFVRQLNFYGFRKVKSAAPTSEIEKNHWEFRHDIFHRDAPHLLSEIKRATHYSSAPDKEDVDSLKGEVNSLRMRLMKMDEKINQLTDLVDNLLRERAAGTPPAPPAVVEPTPPVFTPEADVSSAYMKKRKISVEEEMAMVLDADPLFPKLEPMENQERQSSTSLSFIQPLSNQDLTRMMSFTSTLSEGSFLRELDGMGGTGNLDDHFMDFNFDDASTGSGMIIPNQQQQQMSVLPPAIVECDRPLSTESNPCSDENVAAASHCTKGGGGPSSCVGNVPVCQVPLARSIIAMPESKKCELAEGLVKLLKDPLLENDRDKGIRAVEMAIEATGQANGQFLPPLPEIAMPLALCVLGTFLQKFSQQQLLHGKKILEPSVVNEFHRLEMAAQEV